MTLESPAVTTETAGPVDGTRSGPPSERAARNRLGH